MLTLGTTYPAHGTCCLVSQQDGCMTLVGEKMWQPAPVSLIFRIFNIWNKLYASKIFLSLYVKSLYSTFCALSHNHNPCFHHCAWTKPKKKKKKHTKSHFNLTRNQSWCKKKQKKQKKKSDEPYKPTSQLTAFCWTTFLA